MANAGSFKKGEKKPLQGKRGPGVATKELKEMILGALDQVGGTDYLAEKASDPRTAAAFLALVGKVLPLTIKGPGANGEHVFEAIVRQIVDPKP